MEEFTNTNRNRYYGLRPGDTVQTQFILPMRNCIVKELVRFDNNRVILKDIETGEEFDYVAEWCRILEKIEDKIQNN